MNKKKHDETRELRKFALILMAVACVMSALLIRKGSEKAHYVFFGIAGYAFFAAMFYPRAALPVKALLTKIGRAVTGLITALTLGVLFYLVLTPIGILFRILKKDLLGVRIDRSDATYWIPRKEETPDPKSYENQF